VSVRLDESGPTALDTAAEHLVTNVPRATLSSTAGAARDALIGPSFDSVADVVVLDGERLAGLVPVERLLSAHADAPMSSLMEADPPVVRPGVDQEQAARQLVLHGESSLAVADEDGRFQGLIPPNRMLAVLLEEHDEDLARLGGYLASTRSARSTAVESVRLRLWHRLPWLLLGLGGAIVAAALVGRFKEQLREEVLLAFFVPGVVYMADAVGTQTEAIVIRGIAVGVRARDVLQRELLSGLVIGAVVAAAFFPLAWAIWSDAAVAAGVALALLASCATATVVAMGLPYLLHALGRDPAFGSGPLATVIQDLLSILIYFAVTVPIVF
jgi:magnesium transporter